MVEEQLRRRGIDDARVLAAMGRVPREAFVPPEFQDRAYEDRPLPIAAGQTISQPYIVARMLELAAIGPDDVVLEVGAGSGYAAAVMGCLAAKVYAIERHEALVAAARASLAATASTNVEIIHGDGTRGLPGTQPFAAIIVSAGGEQIPEPLKAQLAVGGRLIMPVGPRHHQTLTRITRLTDDLFEEEAHGLVAFVPLISDAPDSPR